MQQNSIKGLQDPNSAKNAKKVHKVSKCAKKVIKKREIATLLTFSTKERKFLQIFLPNIWLFYTNVVGTLIRFYISAWGWVHKITHTDQHSEIFGSFCSSLTSTMFLDPILRQSHTARHRYKNFKSAAPTQFKGHNQDTQKMFERVTEISSEPSVVPDVQGVPTN